MGKFYELFDDDAHVGVKELGLTYMKAKRPHSGFPESGFNKYAEKLVALGYVHTHTYTRARTHTPHDPHEPHDP